MSPATHHCPGRRFPGRACRPLNADGVCPVHQTFCQRDRIKHLNTEPCPACEKRAFHQELAKQFEQDMRSIKIQVDEKIENLVYEFNKRLGKFVEVSSKKRDGELDGEIDEDENDTEEQDVEDHEKHDEDHEKPAAGGVVENGNN
ncbi:hypothetical protein PG991_001846 [Apiospora marii]|uniref:TAZ-type domain-containing protein n=1 Tax=Apiospora marii TaxID=335849 RepID=A0ABR1SN62_9PEZI